MLLLAAQPLGFAGPSSAPCETAVVGGGWAGVYAAWRLVVDARAAAPSSVCLYEARSAVGGRTYSVDVGELTIDIGAYRFGRHQHLPGDLILDRLNLTTMCYQPDCAPDAEFNQTLLKIVDAEGHNAGYATPIRRMLAELLAAGGRVFYQHELTGVYGAAAGGLALHFAGGAVVGARQVLLNLPRAALQRLDAASAVFPPRASDLAWQLLRNCTPCAPPGAGEALDLKVYAIYDDPWWLTKLNRTEGTFKAVDGDATPPLVGRYHDGPVHRGAAGSLGPGALEAVYTFSFETPEVSYYAPFAPRRAQDPFVQTADPALLVPLHARLMSHHADAFAAVGLNASAVPGMRLAVLGAWSSDPLASLPKPTSSNMHAMVPQCARESCLDGVSPQQYVAAVAAPNPAAAVYVANNDYAWTDYQGVPCCWAEQSLRSVEKTLHARWGLGRPEWLDAAYYAELLSA